MTWVMNWDGREIVSDDFTLGDLGRIEQETGVPWSTLNPLREMKVARAFLAIALERTGGDLSELDGLTLGKIKAVFDFRPDAPFPGGEGDDEDAPLDLSSRASSRGAAAGSSGGRAKRAKSA